MTTGPDPMPLFGPPPTAQQELFAGGPVLATRTGLAAATDQWSAASSNLDLDELAVDLLEVSLRERPGPVGEHAAGRRASALMLAGRFGEALTALPAGLTLPPPGDDLDRDHLVLATCRAALRDESALGWLRQVAPLVSSTDWAGYIAHCLLRVGDARGDWSLSAASLAQLQRLGDKGRGIVPRLAADLLAGRPRGRLEDLAARPRHWGASRDHPMTLAAKDAAGVLRGATDLLHGASESFVSDPALVLDTAELLRQRGDVGGAALLLHAVDRTNPHVRRVETALAAYVPPGARGRRRLRRGLLLGLGAVAFLVSGIAGYPVLALLWTILVAATEGLAREPGLDRFDTDVLHHYGEQAGVRSFLRRPRSVADETPVGLARPVLPLVLAVLALVLGVLVYPATVRAAQAHGPATSWLTAPGLSCFGVWVVAFPVLVMWAASLVPGRRLGYAIPRLTGPQAECRCRRWTYLSGPFAFAYGAAHLVGIATPPALVPVLGRHGPLPPSISSCPATGAAWLVLTLGPENGKILLRSPLGAFPDPQDNPAEDLSTGQYL